MSHFQKRQGWWIGVICIGSVALNGCNVEKARSLQGAALQFRTEAVSAIDAIDTMRKRELEAPPRSPAEVRQSSINNILNSRSDLNARVIDLAIDPYRPPKVAEWDAFISDLKNQYEGFAEIFDQLDRRSVVSTDEVKKSAEYAKTLTVQMALLAKAISENPPVLTQYRTTVIVRLRKIRQDYQTVQVRIKNGDFSGNESLQQLNQRKTDLENQTGDLLGQWQQIKQEEQKLLETTVAQCTKAAAIGKDLIEVANRYDKLSLSDLNAVIPRILTTASTFTGRDYGTVRLRATRIVSEIQSDPLWSKLAQRLIDRANTAVGSRIPASDRRADVNVATPRRN
jgi:hypothetical protein